MKTFRKKIKGYGSIIPLTFILLAFTLITGCKKFIDIPPPTTQLVTTSVFNNNASATSAQIAIYTKMWINAESYDMAQYMGLYADELQNYNTSSSIQIGDYTNILIATNSLWGNYGQGGENYYTYIYDANAVISGLQTTVGCSPAVKQQLTGEAYFTRAFWHFYLTNLFGAVPLVLTTDPNVTGTISRTPRVQVLQQVIADLQAAQGLLSSNYVDGSDTVTTTERVRPTKAAATALLARAYLYLGDYSNGNAADYQAADAAATSVIGNPTYSLSSISGVFLKNSSEAIWQLQTPASQSYDTADGAYFILIAAPSTGSGFNSTTISTQLMNTFEPNDQRKINWIGSYTSGGNTWYFPYKYKNRTYVGQEYNMVLRLSEQYLIRAEARVHEGNTTGAISDLNTIRTRAGLPNYAGSQDAASLLTAVFHEREVELFTEWGHRWFDLERAFATGSPVNAITVMAGANGVCNAKGGTWSSDNHQLLFPIPQSNINADVNLTQNPGY